MTNRAFRDRSTTADESSQAAQSSADVEEPTAGHVDRNLETAVHLLSAGSSSYPARRKTDYRGLHSSPTRRSNCFRKGVIVGIVRAVAGPPQFRSRRQLRQMSGGGAHLPSASPIYGIRE